MRQMSPIEMGGFLKGRRTPSDLKASETNAKYLVRKSGELGSELETALQECSPAGITTDNLKARCAKMAVESTSLKQSEKEFNDFYHEESSEWEDDVIETPVTDASLAEVRAQGVGTAIEAAEGLVAQEYEYRDFKTARSDCYMHPGSNLVGKVEVAKWLVDFVAQPRKGDNQRLYVLLINVDVGSKYHLLKYRVTHGFTYLIPMVWIRWLILVITVVPQQLLRREQRKWLFWQKTELHLMVGIMGMIEADAKK